MGGTGPRGRIDSPCGCKSLCRCPSLSCVVFWWPENRRHYDYEHEQFVNHFNDESLVFDKYADLTKDVTKLGSFSDLMIVSAVSAALNIPIQSYCPPTQNAYFVSEPLSRVVLGRGVSERQKNQMSL